MTRVADWIAEQLWRSGIRDVFMVTGGAAMHLNDAIARHPGLAVTCFHHEQAAAMAAETYWRIEGRMAAVNVTAGPGATNAITGVLGAWNDSAGMVVVSGQVKREHLSSATGLGLRQFGDQEVDIVSMVTGITKSAVLLDDPSAVRAPVERALRLARSGRPGPVWIDVPVDVQGASMDPDAQVPYDPRIDDAAESGATSPSEAASQVRELLAGAERPVVYAGPALRSAGAAARFVRVVERLEVPVVTALNAHDLLPTDHPLNIGRPGLIGDRAGNLAVQNADAVVVLGTRLKIGQVGYDPHSWAPAARVAMVDIDAAELAKPSFHVEIPLHCELSAFVEALERALDGVDPGRSRWAPWTAWCQERRARYPVYDPSYRAASGPVNPYVLFHDLFDSLDDRAVVVAGNSWAGNGSAQMAPVRAGQRLFANSGCGSMGHDLPAALGAAIAAPDRRVVCLAGDGSVQLNIQELQTLVHHQFDVKLFVLNNGGYESIRQTQARFFPDNPCGYDRASGISFPSMERLAAAYGLPYCEARTHGELEAALAATLATPGPAVCEIHLDRSQAYAPKSVAKPMPDGTIVSAPLEDMAPFLPADEVAANVAPRDGRAPWQQDRRVGAAR